MKTEGGTGRHRGLAGEQRFSACAVDAKAADGGRVAHHPQLLVAPEQAQVRHEPVPKRLQHGRPTSVNFELCHSKNCLAFRVVLVCLIGNQCGGC